MAAGKRQSWRWQQAQRQQAAKTAGATTAAARGVAQADLMVLQKKALPPRHCSCSCAFGLRKKKLIVCGRVRTRG